jgi:pSer/pThr/pTyr-binding forkhead associated (FHA) protein
MDEFLASCGADGPLRIDVTGPAPRQSVRCVFEQPCVMIGRELGNDLRLDQDQVSRRHAYLQLMGGRVFCVDLGSRTGLWWAKRTRSSGWLDSPMHIGPYRLQLPDRAAVAGQQSGFDWNPLETAAADQRDLPRLTLEVFDGSQQTLHPLDRVLTLTGRSTACKIQIPNVSVSRYHCSFLLTATGVWVVDLLSREGTMVNGQRMKWACLRPGDRLELGKVLVRLHFEGDVPAGSATSSRPAANGEHFYNPPASDPDLTKAASQALARETPSTRTLVEMAAAPQPLATASFDMKLLEAAGPQGALLVPVLQQFSMMQQQMMDQFQQSMQMVVQVFASMHRDQMGMLQKELDHIHRITRELNELQAEVRASQQRGPSARNGAMHRPFPTRTPPGPAERSAPKPSAPSAPSPATAENAAAAPAPPVPPGGAMPDMGDMHDWLNQRIVTLQKERESRWQKIMGFVLGK